ncbi:hypothetical protein [Nocardioides sp.]|uniref:hypothetical protein n=1 Tax=Nocardioides sp. TaxID=35761 RepID=UPI002638F0AB|nr:hypothetical protein [Nocardioides sp.]
MSGLRTTLAAVLLIASLLVGSFSFVAVWGQHHLLDSDRWTSAVGPLIERPEVQRRVTSALVQAMEENGLPSALAPVASATTARVVATDQFAQVWRTAVRRSHQELVATIRRENLWASVSNQSLSVDLGVLFEGLRERLTAMGVPFASALPTPSGTVDIAASPSLVRALDSARLLDLLAVPSLVATLVLAAAGLLVAQRRATALVIAGLAVVGTALVGLVAWFFARGVALDAADALGGAVLDALTSDVTAWFLAVAAGGAVLAVVGAACTRLTPGR